jgi:regulator of protease activity HflC (stomatin/prohibitin superfamily)
MQPSGLKTSEELQLEREPIRVRETGVWPFKWIIVPPNVYVVHTRAGKKEPVTVGLGVSFRYDPRTDSYLIVPAAMQTIGVVANGISQEKQGINILAYVQWQIHDFAIAYRKLDFSDPRDPLGVVNAQLREQAEAAIKDKVSTMHIEEILTDKAPIIEELTARLKAVAEGRSSGNQAVGEGLGIQIVTVQLKEAYVSSQRLWEHLQAPFRYEQEKSARISYLQAQDEIRQRELSTRKLAETSEAEAQVAIEQIKQTKATEALQLRLTEEQTRFTREQEAEQQKIRLAEQTTLTKQESEQRLKLEAARVEQERKLDALRRAQTDAIEKARLDAEAAARQKTAQVEQALQALIEETRLAESKLQAEQQRLERETTLKQREAELQLLVQEQEAQLQQRIQAVTLAHTRQERLAQLELEEATNNLRLMLQQKEIELTRLQQEVRNLMNERDLTSRLIEKLPELAAHMPEVHELKVLQTGNSDGAFDALTAFLAKMLAVAESVGLTLPKKQELKGME